MKISSIQYSYPKVYSAKQKQSFASNCLEQNKVEKFLYPSFVFYPSLKQKYEMASNISNSLEKNYLSKIDVSNFDKALSQAQDVLYEIQSSKLLSAKQKLIATYAVMIKLLPKTNLHQHTKGALSKESALDLAKRKNYSPEQIMQIESIYNTGKNGFDTLTDFNNAYQTIGKLVSTPSDYNFTIENVIRKASEQGQLTTEIRCATDSVKDDNGQSLTMEEGTKVILNAIEQAKNKLREEGKQVPSIGFVFLNYRGKDWDKSISSATKQAQVAVKTAVENPDMKFGFDIAGPEDTGWRPKAFSDAIDIIKNFNENVTKGEINAQKIGITMHAGETPTFDNGRPGYQSVKEAIEMGVDRIGHGVQAVVDEKTMQMLKDYAVTVEVCGVCNTQSIPVNMQGFSLHPVQQFIDNGIKVSLSTDNDALCDSNITKEYLQFLLTDHNSFRNWKVIKQIAKDGIDSAFISDVDKNNAKSTFDLRINKIESLVKEVLENSNL